MKVDFSVTTHLMQMVSIVYKPDAHCEKFAYDFIEYLGTLDFDEGVFAPNDVHVQEGYRNEFRIGWRMLERPDCFLELQPALDRGNYTVFYSWKDETGGTSYSLGAAIECWYHDGKNQVDALAPNAKLQFKIGADKNLKNWLIERINYFGVRAVDPDASRRKLLKDFDNVCLSGNHC